MCAEEKRIQKSGNKLSTKNSKPTTAFISRPFALLTRDRRGRGEKLKSKIVFGGFGLPLCPLRALRLAAEARAFGAKVAETGL
jgi:hypothetical protein